MRGLLECHRVVPKSPLVYHRMPQNSDLLYLDLDDIPRFHPYGRLARTTDATACASGDDVAGLEGTKIGYSLDDLRDIEHQIGRVVRLHDLPIESCLKRQSARAAGQLVRGDTWTKSARRVEFFPAASALNC